MNKIKWGIMSTASIARKAIIPAIKQTDQNELYAIASRDKKKAKNFAEKFDFNCYYGNYEKLLTDKAVDAIYIPLPNSLHKEWVIKAAKSKKNILCEKPIALNAEETREMIKTASEKDVLLVEAFMYRFQPLVKKVKEMIDSGLIGALKHIEANFCYNSDRPDNDIRFNKSLGGGALYDIGCYTVNVTRYLVGEEPFEVYNVINKRPGCSVDNNGTGILKFPDNIFANINYSISTYDNKDVEINGTNGRIILNGFFDWIKNGHKKIILDKDGKRKEFLIETEDQYVLEVRGFAKKLLQNTPLPFSIEDSLNNMKVMDALREAAAKNQTIKL